MSEGRGYVSHADEMGSIHISEDVLAAIAAAAIVEVEGVGGLAATSGLDITDVLSKKSPRRGIHLQIEEDKITLSVAILVTYGHVIPDVARAVQEAVASSVEATSGLTVEAVNISVGGVIFEKEPKKA